MLKSIYEEKRENISPAKREKGEKFEKNILKREIPNRETRNTNLKELATSHDMCVLWVPGYLYNCVR